MRKSLFCVFALLFAGNAFAQSFVVNPTTFSLSLVGGGEDSRELEVYGVGFPGAVDVVLGAVVSNGEGLAVLLSPSSFSLNPGERQSVVMTVKADIDIAPGNYGISLSASTEIPQAVGGGRAFGYYSSRPSFDDFIDENVAGEIVADINVLDVNCDAGSVLEKLDLLAGMNRVCWDRRSVLEENIRAYESVLAEYDDYLKSLLAEIGDLNARVCGVAEPTAPAGFIVLGAGDVLVIIALVGFAAGLYLLLRLRKPRGGVGVLA